MKTDQLFMHAETLALFQTACKHYRGGITAVAMLMEKSEVLLANKLNPNCAQNRLSLDEAAQILEITQDWRPVNALAHLVGRTTIPLPRPHQSDKELVAHFLALSASLGKIGSELEKATADDSELGCALSRREKQRLSEVFDEMQEVLFLLKHAVQD